MPVTPMAERRSTESNESKSQKTKPKKFWVLKRQGETQYIVSRVDLVEGLVFFSTEYKALYYLEHYPFNFRLDAVKVNMDQIVDLAKTRTPPTDYLILMDDVDFPKIYNIAPPKS